MYDWRTATLQQLLVAVKTLLRHSESCGRVASIAVIAPGAPGSVSLLDGARTDARKLGENIELRQFWRLLAGTVRGGGRVDLLGCGLLDNPEDAACLMQLLALDSAVRLAPCHTVLCLRC